MISAILPALGAVVWDWDPALIRIGTFELRYYGILFALALGVGYMTLRWRYKEEHEDPETATNLTYALMIGVVLGARLGHVFFYDWERFSMNPGDILKFWQGGLASHGATIGIILVCLCYDYLWRKEPARVTLDRMAFTIPFAMICVRLGNFFNSEIVGAPCPADHPFAFIFVRYDAIPRFPSQLFEACMGIIAFILLYGTYYLYKRRGKLMPLGLSSSIILVSYFTMRFFIEFFKEYQDGEIETGLRMGQQLSIPFVALGLIGILMCTIGPWKNQTALQFTKRYQLSDEAMKALQDSHKKKGESSESTIEEKNDETSQDDASSK